MEKKMDTIKAIHTRRSVRNYQDKPIAEELITKILAAGMAAPSARNQQPWEFVVITDKNTLEKIPTINPFTQMALKAPLAILICGNLELETASGYWVIDCAAATQNMLLCAHALGLGGVWTGTYPNEDRMDGYTELLGIPESVIPHSLIVIGYPAEQPTPEDRFKPDRIHYNQW
jgi:nitroreductase